LDESIHEVIMNATVEELALLKESVIVTKEEIAELIETESPLKHISVNPKKKKKSVNFNNNDVVIEDIEEDIYEED